MLAMNRNGLPYKIEEIRQRVAPIAVRYHLKAVYLFGSYARGEATKDSDIDFLVDTEGAGLDTLFKLGRLYAELEDAFACPIDLVTVASLHQPSCHASRAQLRENIWQEKVDVYIPGLQAFCEEELR